MMENVHCVLITVTGADEHGETSLSTRGTLAEAPGGGWVLEYEETNPEDMTTVESVLYCEADRVTVTRAGTALSTIVFDRGETFVGDYPTPYGNFQVRVYASEVDIKRRGMIGHIHLVYQISLYTLASPSEETATRVLDIRFTPCRH